MTGAGVSVSEITGPECACQARDAGNLAGATRHTEFQPYRNPGDLSNTRAGYPLIP